MSPKHNLVWTWFYYMPRWLIFGAWVAWALFLPLAALPILVILADELWLRVLGLALQLAGLAVAICTVVAVGKLFGLPTVKDRVKAWWNRRPGARQHLAVDFMSGISATSQITARYGLQPINEGDDLVEKVNKIARNQLALQRNSDETQQHLDGLKKQLQQAFREEQVARSTQIDTMKTSLEKATAGSPAVTLLGLYWIALGLLLATFPKELLDWLSN